MSTLYKTVYKKGHMSSLLPRDAVGTTRVSFSFPGNSCNNNIITLSLVLKKNLRRSQQCPHYNLSHTYIACQHKKIGPVQESRALPNLCYAPTPKSTRSQFS